VKRKWKLIGGREYLDRKGKKKQEVGENCNMRSFKFVAVVLMPLRP
jgi:hypothetical protein